MNRTLRRALGTGLAVLVTLAIAALSRIPYTATTGDQALLRLSWRAPGEVVEECRRLSAEELAELPVHMRREEVCERFPLPYRLRVLLDGQPLIEERVEPAGARRDRPLYVLREVALAPGDYRVEVTWQPEAAAGTPMRPARAGRIGALALTASLRLQPGDIALITYDPDRRTLTARGSGVVAAEALTP